MKKAIIFDIRRFCVHDGQGIRTTVFFKGCPLSCWWCHNPESRDLHAEKSVKHLALDGQSFEREETTGKWMTVAEVMAEVLQDRIFYDESGGGVTFSGGEPMLQEAFLADTLKECRKQGIHTTLDTSGYASQDAMAEIAGLVDLFLYDVKIINEDLHIKYTGVSNKQILENLKFLYTSGNNVILRFPVIPGITDTNENIRDMKEFINKELIKKHPSEFIITTIDHHLSTLSHLPGKTSAIQDISTVSPPYMIASAHKLSLLPYHAMAREKYRRFCKSNFLEHLPDLKPEELLPLKAEFESIGMNVNIGG